MKKNSLSTYILETCFYDISRPVPDCQDTQNIDVSRPVPDKHTACHIDTMLQAVASQTDLFADK